MGAFPQEDRDQDSWSKITQIMVYYGILWYTMVYWRNGVLVRRISYHDENNLINNLIKTCSERPKNRYNKQINNVQSQVKFDHGASIHECSVIW